MRRDQVERTMEDLEDWARRFEEGSGYAPTVVRVDSEEYTYPLVGAERERFIRDAEAIGHAYVELS